MRSVMPETRNSVTWATIKWTIPFTILWTWASRIDWIWESRIGHARFEDPVPRSPRTSCTSSRRRSGTLSIQTCSPGKSSRCDWICPRLGCRWVRLTDWNALIRFSLLRLRLGDFSPIIIIDATNFTTCSSKGKCKNAKVMRRGYIRYTYSCDLRKLKWNIRNTNIIIRLHSRHSPL